MAKTNPLQSRYLIQAAELEIARRQSPDVALRFASRAYETAKVQIEKAQAAALSAYVHGVLGNYKKSLDGYDHAIALAASSASSNQNDRTGEFVQRWQWQKKWVERRQLETTRLTSFGLGRAGKLNPQCGLVSLIISATHFDKSYESKLLKFVKVGGFGSNLAELVKGAASAGLESKVITPNKDFMIGWNAPLVAFVGNERFIIIEKTTKDFVVIRCPSCPEDSAQRKLTWNEWKQLSCTALLVIAPKDSLENEALKQMGTSLRNQNLNLASIGKGASSGTFNAKLISILPRIEVFSTAYLSNIQFGGLPSEKKPGTPNNRLGDGDPVDLSTGEEIQILDADLLIYNRIGPSVSFSQNYHSFRNTLAEREQTSNELDFGQGWTHNYDYKLLDTNFSTVPQITAAVRVPDQSGIKSLRRL